MESLIGDLWVCYILKSTNPSFPNHTYVGSTNSVKRRIRQHNCEITGGAKATKIAKPHEFYCVVAGFSDKISSLKCEWLLKHPSGSRKSNGSYYGIIGRIKGLNHLLLHSEKWKLRSLDVKLTVWIKNEFSQYLDIEKYLNVDVVLV